jgi:hypothetical protein
MKMKASFAALVSLLVLTAASRQPEPWSPGFWCSEDGPRQLPVVVTVTPVKAVFEAGDPLIVRVTITNNLRAEIGFLTYATEMKDWNGEVWNLSMVEIGRPGGLTIPASYRPVVMPPAVIAGVSRQRVAPGQTLTITTNLRKWDIGGWDPAEYAFRFAVSGIGIDDNTTATIRTPCARFSIRR